jgi:hypothetical protein
MLKILKFIFPIFNMHSLLFTFGIGFIGALCIAFALLYKQDSYPTMKWYQVLGQDIGVRITFAVLGLLFLGYAGFFQFRLNF